MLKVTLKGMNFMPSTAQLKSFINAQKRLKSYLKTLNTVPMQELKRTAEQMYPKIVAQTPYKTGKLEQSVRVTASGTPQHPVLTAVASAKSGNYDYASIQHEETSYNHPIKGKAHYIRDPWNQEVRNMRRRINRKLRRKHGS